MMIFVQRMLKFCDCGHIYEKKKKKKKQQLETIHLI